jgi:predicted RNase H-like nuclease
MNHSKKTPEGLLERRRLLAGLFPGTEQVIQEAVFNPAFRGRVRTDDVLDALAAAVTGPGIGPDLCSIQGVPEFDNHNLPMEKVFRRIL